MKIEVTVYDASQMDIEDLDRVLNTMGYGDRRITNKTPWPLLKFGDTFTYSGIEYMFVGYENEEKTKARAYSVEDMQKCCTIQPMYFDCTQQWTPMEFNIK